MSITRHLVDAFPESYSQATQHPFLKIAGSHTLHPNTLSSWLTQDYIYTGGYCKLVGFLLSRITEAPLALQRQTLKLLSTAVQNIYEEQAFFERVAEEHNLDLKKETAGGPSLAEQDTANYVDFMIAVGSRYTFEEGLVLLWATEKCYLDAWTYASKQPPAQEKAPAFAALTSAALYLLIENWSSPAFAAFVEELGQLVDDLGISPGKDQRCLKSEGIMKRVLYLEERFWPTEVKDIRE